MITYGRGLAGTDLSKMRRLDNSNITVLGYGLNGASTAGVKSPPSSKAESMSTSTVTTSPKTQGGFSVPNPSTLSADTAKAKADELRGMIEKNTVPRLTIDMGGGVQFTPSHSTYLSMLEDAIT